MVGAEIWRRTERLWSSRTTLHATLTSAPSVDSGQHIHSISVFRSFPLALELAYRRRQFLHGKTLSHLILRRVHSAHANRFRWMGRFILGTGVDWSRKEKSITTPLTHCFVRDDS